jgi:cytoskeletal protein CcmA (bactofilin family)
MKGPAMKSPVVLAILLALLASMGPSDVVKADRDEVRHEDGARKMLVVVPAGAVIDRDYFAFGRQVEISGTVNGDVYAVGGQVLVDGKVNGDLLATGGAVTVSGSVTQDVRVGGGHVAISGEVGRNVTVAGGNIQFAPAAAIHGGVVAAGGNVHLAGLIGRDVKVGAGNLTISDRIGGNLKAAAGAIRLTSKARVTGNLTYWSRATASIDEHALVSGQIVREPLPDKLAPSPEELVGVMAAVKLAWIAMSFTSTLILGLLFIRFYPNATEKAVARLREQPLSVLGSGFLVFVITPVAIVLLAISLLGLPLAIILAAIYLLYLYVARIFVIAWGGQTILGSFGGAHGRYRAFVVGLIVYSLLQVIPLLGGLVTMAAVLFGLGALLFVKKDYYAVFREQGML